MTTLRAALAERVVVADGAIGTMLQASDATVGDFAGHEGCNEIRNVIRPDILAGIHEAYPQAGAECLTTSGAAPGQRGLLESGVVYRYLRCVSEGNDLVILGEDGSTELRQLHPGQSTGALVARHPHAKYFSV
jgi:hypothetical protein